MSSLASTTPSPTPNTLDPTRPLHNVVYVYSDMPLSKGHLGSGGGGKHLKTNRKTPVTNVTVLSIFRMHAQEGYCKVLEMNSTSILYSLALLLF